MQNRRQEGSRPNRPNRPGQIAKGGQPAQRQGGANQQRRQNQPQKTLRIGGDNIQGGQVVKKVQLQPSNTRLKVRNIDEKQVTNDDLKVSIGQKC